MKLFNYIKIKCKLILEYFLFRNLRQKTVSELKFRQKIIKTTEYRPVFFLSTGRTGTQLFTELLQKSKKVQVFHSPSSLFCNAQSELIEQSKVAYESYKEFGFNDTKTNLLMSQIILSAREDLLYKTYLHNKVYIETNNRITFLVPAIKQLFPNARFVHIYRHPGEFVRSGIRRKYYIGDDIHQLGMITPIQTDSLYNTWKDMDSIQKISWLWNETNTFIDTFLNTLDDDDYIHFNFNNLTIENINRLLNFLNIDDILENDIQNAIDTPINIQKKGFFDTYTQWDSTDKNKLKNICEAQSNNYGYIL